MANEDQRELLARALAAVKDLRTRLAAHEQKASEAIAIVGMGCRFPGGAESPEAFWRLLKEGRSAVADIPPARFPIASYYDPNPDAPGKISLRRAALFPEIDRFDADFFGISPREAAQMDPQQRLALEVAWEALEDAGQTVEGLSRSATGVFFGAIAADYAWLQLNDPTRIDAYTGTGTHSSLISGRLSWLLDLRGPSLTLDSACSSSLVAVHLACQSLRRRECSMALAGGVNLVSSPVSLMLYSRMGLLAPDGLCKTFDSRADGFVPGEGCGVVVLRRLSDALADRDNIRAVIRGSAANQDGRSSTLTAPNGPSQVGVISRALEDAGVEPGRISYIEAHGTGTALGDPIEVEALRSVIDANPSAQPCAVSSVKTNIGHLGAAAGIAGLIKAVLCQQHKAIPGHLNFERLSPHISLEGSRLFIPLAPLAWADPAGPLTAGVSSFGWSGTNAHVILEEAPAAPARGDARGETCLLPLSARSPEALAALASAYSKALLGDESLRDFCYTASVRRTHHKYRLALTLQAGEEPVSVPHENQPDLLARGVAFVFCGQGALAPGSGRELYRREEVFRASIDETDAIVRRLAGWSVRNELDLDQTEFAQPVNFALQVALARLWQSWGIAPAAVIGHSVGEAAAAHIAGVLSLEDAVRVVVSRARHMQSTAGQGAMAEIELTPDLLREHPNLTVAAYNSPTAVVLAGTPTEIAALTHATPLRPKYAFHSPQMDPCVPPLIRDLHALRPQPAAVPIYSTVHGAPASGEDFTAAYWGQNVRQPVLFSAALGRMIDDGYRMFVEIGPHPVLSPAIAASLTYKNAQGATLPSLHRKRPEHGSMLESLGALYTAGANVRWKAVAPAGNHFRPLPPYPWQRKRYWVDSPGTPQAEEIGCYEIVQEPITLKPADAPVQWLLLEDTPADINELLKGREGEWNILFACQESEAEPVRKAVLLAQACLESRDRVKLWFVTRGTLAHAPLTGLGRTIAVESPEVWGGLIEIPPGPESHHEAILACIASGSSLKEFAVRAEGIFVPRFTQAQPPPLAPVAVPAGKSYLIAGGCGGVGLALARVLADAGARRLILFGRSEPSASASAVIEELRTRGVDCTICRGDVTVPDDVARAVAACGDSLAGVIHAAGVVHDAAVPSIDPGELQALLAAKTVGARNLHEATAQRPLDFFVLCSSLSSVVGSPGQGAYSAANAYLDCLAWHRRSLGLPALSINWGPWDGIGMTAALPESARVRWADRGIAPFSAAAGAAMFLRLAASRYTQISAAIIDWTRFHRTPEETAARQSLPAWLHSEAARILKVGVADLPLDRNLMELGFDSLMVMELLRALHRNFHIRAYPREFYQNPSVAAFAACLSEESAASACTPARLDIPIAFLLSAPRSGSTLLRVMLAGHPGVFCPPELHLLGYKTMRERDTALKGTYLQEGLLRALQELLPNGTPEAAKALEQEWIAADLPIQTVYAHLAEMAGGRLLIDKSPSYAGNRETLRQAEEIFANARYVHLLRHPLSVIDSFVKNRFDRLLGLTGKPPREAAEEIWIESNANVADLFRSVDRNRTNTLRYEDLVGHPAQAMGGLCAFLGLPFDEAVLRPYEAGRMTDGLQAQSVGIGDPNFLNHRDIDPSLADAWRSVRGDVSPKARALAAQFQYELPQTSASSTISEQRIAVRGLSLCLCTWGPPDGAPVFIVHGALDHAAAWEEVALALAARGFRVFAPDQRGHGLSQHVSPEGSYHLMDFLADADTILRQVTAAPVTLVGHSMGASLAALLAAARPGAVKKLIMVEPLLAKDRADRNNSEILSAHLNGIEFEPKPQTFADADKATQRLREFHPSLDAVQAAKMAARLLQPCPEGVRWRWDERVRSLAGIAYHGTFDLDAPRFLSILSEIAIPVTLVRGTGSEIVPREQIIRQLDALRDGREAALPGGHNLHLDCPAELARIIAGDVS